MTLRALLEFSENNNYTNITKTTLRNYLSSQLYTLKNITNHPIERNSPEKKIDKFNFFRKSGFKFDFY